MLFLPIISTHDPAYKTQRYFTCQVKVIFIQHQILITCLKENVM